MHHKRNLFLLLILLLFSGCDLARDIGLPISLTIGESATPSAATGAPAGTPAAAAGTPATTPETPGASTGTPGASPGTPAAPDGAPAPSTTPVQSLTLWAPPEFDPDGGTPAGDLLRARLDAFSKENGGVRVQVRIKAASGPGGLLESLNNASAVAPMALPSVIALPRADLETAALKGLVVPLDSLSTAINQPDWYDYARELAMVQGATFALPFAGDALLIAYRPTSLPAAPTTWQTIEAMGQPLAFPAGDVQALFLLTLYQSIGGSVEDAQRRPTLQPDLLSQALQVLADGEQRAVFPYWLSQYETSGQVWQAYREQRVNALVTWASNYLASLPPDTTAVPLPALDEAPLTLATGWGWSVADPVPERRALSVKLAEFLADAEFLAAWTEAAGYLPTHPSSLAAWTNGSLKSLLGPVADSAKARPSGDQLASLGPVLQEATLKVLKHESDPTQAAKAASERLAVPEAK